MTTKAEFDYKLVERHTYTEKGTLIERYTTNRAGTTRSTYKFRERGQHRARPIQADTYNKDMYAEARRRAVTEELKEEAAREEEAEEEAARYQVYVYMYNVTYTSPRGINHNVAREYRVQAARPLSEAEALQLIIEQDDEVGPVWRIGAENTEIRTLKGPEVTPSAVEVREDVELLDFDH
jgi:osmotically-inducible protein OsmY